MNPKEIQVYNITLPNESLSNFQLIDAVKKLKIPNFRGVFLRDELPKIPKKYECGILNFDDNFSKYRGTHWVAWYRAKRGMENIYFDSYGIQPPTELKDYIGTKIYYSTEQVQPANQVFCGHLCLFVLKSLSLGKRLQDIINLLY